MLLPAAAARPNFMALSLARSPAGLLSTSSAIGSFDLLRPPRTCSDHTTSMTRWLPRTQVRGLEKLGANAKIDLRPCISLFLGGLPKDR